MSPPPSEPRPPGDQDGPVSRDRPDSDPSDGGPDALEARIARLERLVEGLMATQARAGAGPDTAGAAAAGAESAPSEAPDPADVPPPPRSRAPRPRRPPVDWVKMGEDWLGRIGALLLVLGLAFLYRWAVERGWITPWLRVSFGGLLGVGLLGFGLTRVRDRPRYSQALLGGAVAVLYLTGWAAHALYELVPWIVGFSWMATVTVLALALAERRGHQVLAVIGAAGGLATPFLVPPADGSVTGLVGYSMLVLGWAGLLQLRRGWGVLLAVNVVGGLAVMALAADEAAAGAVWSAQAGIVAAWAVGCVFPFLLARLHVGAPDTWPAPPAPHLRWAGLEATWRGRSAVLWALGVAVSAAAVALTVIAWDLGRVGGGVAFLVVAGLLMGGSRWLGPDGRVARPALGAGALLLLVGSALAAGSDWMPLPLAVEAAALLMLSHRLGSPGLAVLGHTAFAVLALQFLGRVRWTYDASLLSAYAGASLAAIATAGVTGAAFRETGLRARIYLVGSYVAFLAWLAWRLSPLSGGPGLVSAAWGACAVILLVTGGVTGHRGARLTGLATLAAVAAKLLLVDLAALDAGIRILLFLGFGGLFLGLGYAFRGRDSEEQVGGAAAPPDAS